VLSVMTQSVIQRLQGEAVSMNITEEELQKVLNDNPDLRVCDTIQPPVSHVQPSKRQHKYNVSPPEDRTYQGVLYASKAECKKAKELDLQQKAGEIDYVLRQVPFPLPGNITYRADFVTLQKVEYYSPYPTWIVKVIEVKGFSTPEWKLKYKLFKATFPLIDMEIVK
jgi:hypothetical protein